MPMPGADSRTAGRVGAVPRPGSGGRKKGEGKMALFAMLTGFALGAEPDIACTFKGDAADDPVVSVKLLPVPSLKDRPGLHRVMMQVDEAKVPANARPMPTTDETDVMIRASSRSNTVFTIGLRADGVAAIHVSRDDAKLTLHGRCEEHEAWFPIWSDGPRAE